MKVTVAYRKGHEGVLLSRIDPRAWADAHKIIVISDAEKEAA